MGKRMKISILGTEYDLLERSVKDDVKLTDADGYCDTSTKVCVVDDMSDPDYDSKGNLEEYKNQLKRHEIIHAFLFESGLDVNTWAGNEEIVDWIAIQFPKLLRAFEKAGCIPGRIFQTGMSFRDSNEYRTYATYCASSEE